MRTKRLTRFRTTDSVHNWHSVPVWQWQMPVVTYNTYRDSASWHRPVPFAPSYVTVYERTRAPAPFLPRH
jgi:hypothetical protein